MQDEDITQTANPSSDSPADTTVVGGNEPELSLGTNPILPAQDPPAESASEAAVEEASPAETSSDPAVSITPPTDDSSSDSSEDSSVQTPETAEESQPSDESASGGLESIKSSALQELMPLVNELDQEPEDKYRTLMMLIQSSDNQSLVQDAYDAAAKIEDKKAKAEALLNIVNEINYLTGKAGKSDEV